MPPGWMNYATKDHGCGTAPRSQTARQRDLSSGGRKRRFWPVFMGEDTPEIAGDEDFWSTIRWAASSDAEAIMCAIARAFCARTRQAHDHRRCRWKVGWGAAFDRTQALAISRHLSRARTVAGTSTAKSGQFRGTGLTASQAQKPRRCICTVPKPGLRQLSAVK